jgi:hypothetical protein
MDSYTAAVRPRLPYRPWIPICPYRIWTTVLLSDERIIHLYTDSDWGSDRTHRRSVTGTLLMYWAPQSPQTPYQPTAALSSTEAEFVAASDTGKDLLIIGPY